MKRRLFRNNLRPYAQLWYNEPIDYDCGVAERKGSLNRRCLLGLWYNNLTALAEAKILTHKRKSYHKTGKSMSKKGKRLREFEKNNREFNISEAQRQRQERRRATRERKKLKGVSGGKPDVQGKTDKRGKKKNKKIKNSLLLSLSRKSLIFFDSFKYVYSIFLRSNIGTYLSTII